jgi:hypothetical protein
METNPKSTKTKAENIETSFCPATYATLFNKGIKLVLEVSKTSLNSATEQNSEVLASYKQTLKASSRPSLFLVDLAGQAFERHVTLQKSLLDMSVEQSGAVAEAARDYIHDPSQDRTVTAQISVVVFRRTPPRPRIRAAS